MSAPLRLSIPARLFAATWLQTAGPRAGAYAQQPGAQQRPYYGPGPTYGAPPPNGLPPRTARPRTYPPPNDYYQYPPGSPRQVLDGPFTLGGGIGFGGLGLRDAVTGQNTTDGGMA